MKILLVEDDMATVDSIKLCMEIYEPDLNLTCTTHGLEAVRLVKEDDFGLIIIDLGLPDIDGTEVLLNLRRFSKVPVIILSARHDPPSIYQTLQLGVDDYILKPFSIHDFLKRIRKSLVKAENLYQK